MPITLQNVTFAYPGTPVLSNASLTFPETGAVRLLGASGCGKTTLLRLLAGLEAPQSGTISGLADRRLSVVFQNDRLFPWMTVLDNVSLAAKGPAAREIAVQMLQAVGLSESAGAYPAQLSGGMRRRTAIARTLARGGDLLLLDEPFTGIDPALQETIRAAFLDRFSGGLIVLVTHVEQEASAFAPKTLRLSSPITGLLAFS